MMGEMCNDGRFEEIKETKDYIIRATNIDTSEEEMNVLDQICFRLWQLGLTKKNKDEFNKIKNILEEYNVTPEILREVLLKGQMARHIPTLEEVKKDWEELGYTYQSSFDNKKLITLIKMEEISMIKFDIKTKMFMKTDMITLQEAIPFTFQEHNLLTKTFRALGWFE